MKIIPLSEGRFTIDGSKVFVPFNSDTDDLYSRPTGSLLVEIQPFLVITQKDIILVDTGLGFSDEYGNAQIHLNMMQQGVQPESVTKVLMSHLHKDHAGGMLHDGRPAFPNARYHIHQQEMNYALEKGFPSYQPEDFETIRFYDDVVWLEGEGNIDEQISFATVGGHCPYHTVFWIKASGETVFFGGDVAPQLQQMKTRFTTKYDYEPKKSMELRTQFWQQGKNENWKMLFYHDISNPVVSL